MKSGGPGNSSWEKKAPPIPSLNKINCNPTIYAIINPKMEGRKEGRCLWPIIVSTKISWLLVGMSWHWLLWNIAPPNMLGAQLNRNPTIQQQSTQRKRRTTRALGQLQLHGDVAVNISWWGHSTIGSGAKMPPFILLSAKNHCIPWKNATINSKMK